MWQKRNKHKNGFLGRNKVNNIQNAKSKALTDAEISHKEFLLVSNQIERYNGLKRD